MKTGTFVFKVTIKGVDRSDEFWERAFSSGDPAQFVLESLDYTLKEELLFNVEVEPVEYTVSTGVRI